MTVVRTLMNTFPRSAGPLDPRALKADRTRDSLFQSLSGELRCTLDEQGRFAHVEGAWTPQLGWSTSELLGRHWNEITHEADRARVGDVLASLRRAESRAIDVSTRVATRDGDHRVIAWTVASAHPPDRVAAVGRAKDEPATGTAVSRLERRNRDLEERTAALEARCAALESFASTAAHELAEPLIIAESSARLVREALGEELDPFLAERLGAIGRSAARARDLMDAILQDARAASEPLQVERVSLQAVVGESIAGFERRREFRASFEVGSLPSVSADARLMAVIVDNLLGNALKHGRRTDSCVRVNAERVREGWRLDVHSKGPPIDDQHADRIFEPFQRGPSERRLAGSGLGLTICARLVRRLGGDIGLRAGERGGNTFWIVLPDPV